MKAEIFSLIKFYEKGMFDIGWKGRLLDQQLGECLE
jgi:hypothetical protein